MEQGKVSQWPKNFSDLYCIVIGVIQQCSRFDDSQQAEFSQKICMGICSELGGKQFYLPNVQRALNELRDNLMFDEFNKGNDHEYLAKKYSVTTRRVYQILKKQQLLREAAPLKRIH